MDTSALTIRIADPADAAALLHVIHQAFAARPAVDPPAEALTDEVADIERALTDGFGVVVEREGRIIAGLLVDIVVQEGQKVQAGEKLAVIEAMKMENVLLAAQDGVVGKLVAGKGESLSVDQVILEFQ